MRIALAALILLACTPAVDATPPMPPPMPSAPMPPAPPPAPPTPPPPVSAPDAPPPPPPSAAGKTACATDAECVISTFPGCCACPQHGEHGSPHALSKTGAAEEQSLCARVRCDMTRCASAPPSEPPEPASFYVAKCTKSTCTRVRVK